jgi:hypothetical protein
MSYQVRPDVNGQSFPTNSRKAKIIEDQGGKAVEVV